MIGFFRDGNGVSLLSPAYLYVGDGGSLHRNSENIVLMSMEEGSSPFSIFGNPSAPTPQVRSLQS